MNNTLKDYTKFVDDNILEQYSNQDKTLTNYIKEFKPTNETNLLSKLEFVDGLPCLLDVFIQQNRVDQIKKYLTKILHKNEFNSSIKDFYDIDKFIDYVNNNYIEKNRNIRFQTLLSLFKRYLRFVPSLSNDYDFSESFIKITHTYIYYNLKNYLSNNQKLLKSHVKDLKPKIHIPNYISYKLLVKDFLSNLNNLNVYQKLIYGLQILIPNNRLAFKNLYLMTNDTKYPLFNCNKNYVLLKNNVPDKILIYSSKKSNYYKRVILDISNSCIIKKFINNYIKKYNLKNNESFFNNIQQIEMSKDITKISNIISNKNIDYKLLRKIQTTHLWNTNRTEDEIINDSINTMHSISSQINKYLINPM